MSMQKNASLSSRIINEEKIGTQLHVNQNLFK